MNTEEQQNSTITKEQLIENGWVRTIDDCFLYEKVLGETKEDGKLTLVLHRMVNVIMFAVCLPDGGLLNINPATMEELNDFEKMIIGYMPNY